MSRDSSSHPADSSYPSTGVFFKIKDVPSSLSPDETTPTVELSRHLYARRKPATDSSSSSSGNHCLAHRTRGSIGPAQLVDTAASPAACASMMLPHSFAR